MSESLVLTSGEALTRAEILEGVLLLARDEASFPIIGEQDAHLAILLLIPTILEFNKDEEVI